MIALPDDIARQIAAELDLQSARCLARAGKSVRDIGEMRVWQRVHVRMREVSDVNDLKLTYPDTPLQRLLHSLESYPARIAYLSELTFSQPPRTDPSMRLTLRLLSVISSTVQHLDLHLPPIGPADLAHLAEIIERYHSFLKQLSETVRTWDKVLELRISVVGRRGLALARALIAACPRLQALTLCPLNVLDPLHASSDPEAELDQLAFPPLPNLESLAIIPLLPPRPSGHIDIPVHLEAMAFKAIHERCREVLDRIVPQAPNIEALVIDGPHLLDGPTLKRTIESLPKLRRLFLDITCDVQWGPVTQLETDVAVLWLRMSSLYGSRAGASMLNGPRHTSTPYLPTIPHLRVLSFCGPSIDMRSRCQKSWRDPGPEPYLVELSTAMDDVILTDHFRFQPKLEIVLMEPTNPDWRLLCSFGKGLGDQRQHRIVARKYAHPFSRNDKEERAFWHIRSTRPHSTSPCGHTAVYKNRLVPAAIIRKVYQAGGQSIDWLSTKFDCRFGTSGADEVVDLAKEADGWDVLEQWANQGAEDDPKDHQRPSIFPPVAL